MKFFYIYKALAHPETNGYVTPFTLKERLMHIKEAQRTLGSKIDWICDSMKNDLKRALGNSPNSEFIIGPDLKVLVKRRWSDPAALRKDLEKLIGKVPKPTRVSDLKMKRLPPLKAAATGIVKRLTLPGRMQALKIEPIAKDGGQPFYAKLRAEADSSLLRSGKGKLYLRFQLDPLYKVHWNNLTRPISVTLTPPKGMKLSKTKLDGPKVKVEADIDPREFLIDVDATDIREPLKLSVRYYACNDDAGWCKLIVQEYTVRLVADRDAGRVSRRGGRGGRRGFGGRGGPGGFTRRMPQPGQILPDFLQQFLQLTADQKKKISELQKHVDAKLGKILTAAQKKQLKQMIERRGRFGRRGRGGFGPPGGDPNGGRRPR